MRFEQDLPYSDPAGCLPLPSATTRQPLHGVSSPMSAGHLPLALVIPAGTDDEPQPVVSETKRFARVKRDAVYRRLLAVADALAATCALLFSMLVAGNHHPRIAMLATVPLIIIVSKLIGAYDGEDLLVRKSTLDEAPVLFQLATLCALIGWLINSVVISGAKGRSELLLLWVTLFLLLMAFRAAARVMSRRLTEPERCLVIGDAGTRDWLRAKFAGRPALHAVVVANVDREGSDGAAPATEDHEVDVENLRDTVSFLRIDRVMITTGRADEAEVIHLVHAATTLGLKVSVLPRVLEIVGSSVKFDDVEGLPLLSMGPPGLTQSSWFAKRGLDIVVSAFGLLIVGPVMVLVAVAIKLDSSGTIFFRQHRIGRDGNGFEMLKFRTMAPDADARKHEVLHLNQAHGLFKIAEDPRITRVGRVLRRTSLDELPQLLNVFRGEMSLVGPRPLIAEEDRRIEGWRRRRLHLMPGMTGHWQILGSARVPLEEMARIDYLYVTNWSLWLDVKILMRTVPYVFARRGL
jgi:exopolysaccharide biosynthesis polyprenyl glycosylphosphotransferase